MLWRLLSLSIYLPPSPFWGLLVPPSLDSPPGVRSRGVRSGGKVSRGQLSSPMRERERGTQEHKGFYPLLGGPKRVVVVTSFPSLSDAVKESRVWMTQCLSAELFCFMKEHCCCGVGRSVKESEHFFCGLKVPRQRILSFLWPSR